MDIKLNLYLTKWFNQARIFNEYVRNDCNKLANISLMTNKKEDKVKEARQLLQLGMTFLVW